MLLGSPSATRRYKVRPYAIKTDEAIVITRGMTRVEIYSMADISTMTGGILIFAFLEVVGLIASYTPV